MTTHEDLQYSESIVCEMAKDCEATNEPIEKRNPTQKALALCSKCRNVFVQSEDSSMSLVSAECGATEEDAALNAVTKCLEQIYWLYPHVAANLSGFLGLPTTIHERTPVALPTEYVFWGDLRSLHSQHAGEAPVYHGLFALASSRGTAAKRVVARHVVYEDIILAAKEINSVWKVAADIAANLELELHSYLEGCVVQDNEEFHDITLAYLSSNELFRKTYLQDESQEDMDCTIRRYGLKNVLPIVPI
eukprot:TRINITY_DN729_c0_g1_i1.p1 TRINITY_DN729_c0_g1~~TRINITY_DN729_c0_g1_i1.p1  ORF type:complete len:248 (+),score=47.03 TRINITY_DN729_c0_g1_i1:407-1150(+)